jgi:hypothetical protein
MWYNETGLPGSRLAQYAYLDTAIVYPAKCLFEGIIYRKGGNRRAFFDNRAPLSMQMPAI